MSLLQSLTHFRRFSPLRDVINDSIQYDSSIQSTKAQPGEPKSLLGFLIMNEWEVWTGVGWPLHRWQLPQGYIDRVLNSSPSSDNLHPIIQRARRTIIQVSVLRPAPPSTFCLRGNIMTWAYKPNGNSLGSAANHKEEAALFRGQRGALPLTPQVSPYSGFKQSSFPSGQSHDGMIGLLKGDDTEGIDLCHR